MTLELLPDILQNLYNKDALVYDNDELLYYNTEFDKDLLKDILNHDFQIYNGTYRHDYQKRNTDILLSGRGRNCGKKSFRVQGYSPYCWIDYKEPSDWHTYLGKPVEKLIFEGEPKTVANYRRKQEELRRSIPYEADVKFVQRFLIDTYDIFKPTYFVEPKIAILDIETNFPVNNNIISFCLNGYDGYLYYNSSVEEGNKWSIALDIYTKIQDYDIITNWNVEFDLIETLEPKIEALKMFLKPINEGYQLSKKDYLNMLLQSYNHFNLNICQEIWNALESYGFITEEDGFVKQIKEFDDDISFIVTPVELLPISKKMYGREIPGRWSLDNVGTRLCGIGKVDLEGRYPRDLTQEELLEYNVRDSIIPEIIDEYLGGIPCHIILSWSIHSIINDTIVTAEVNDIALMRNYHKAKKVLNSRSSKFLEESEKLETYKAAEPDARPGVYEKVISTDLHAAYPSAVLAINASSETKDLNGKYIAPNGVRFNDGYSIFIETLKELLKEREVIKLKLKSTPKDSNDYRTLKFIDFALKTQVAAFSHGIFGWEDSRMKDIEVADAICATVRGILDEIKNYVDNYIGKWIYLHTDSCYFIINQNISPEESINNLNSVIESYCNVKKYSIIPHLDYKGFYPKAYIHSAARNVLVDENGEWEVTGMNFERSEVPEPLADIEKELIKMKLNYEINETLMSTLKEMVKELKNADSRDLGLIKPLTKSISRYGKIKDGIKIGIPYHIKALQLAEQEYGFTVKVGEKFQILPIIVDEWEGVRVKRRKKVFMAYSLEDGIPSNYLIDFESYLRSNLWGKVSGIFGLAPKELEKQIMTEDMKSFMYYNM